MNILLIFAVAYPMLAAVTWVLFLAIMKLRDRRDALPASATRMGMLVLLVGYVFDFLFNIASSVLFLEFPREWLFTARASRLCKLTGWRSYLARWFRDNWLDCIDPGHCR